MFRAAGFPTVDAPPIDDAVFADYTTVKTTAELDAALKAHPFDVLVLPYGSAFPVDAWPAIRGFVRGGGSLVNLGGAPFGQPVFRSGNDWKLGPASPAFQHELLIGPAEPIAAGNGVTTWALTLRLATEKNFPAEHGSAGPRLAKVRGLEFPTPRTCSLLQIDRIRGSEAGARWLFATTNEPHDTAWIKGVIQRALHGADVEAPVKHAPVDVGDLKKGPRLSVGRDWLLKDGKPFPIVGTTYMAGDVDRDFLFEPNPDVWDADFQKMQEHRINFVRTGLWTAWSRVMKDGVVDPAILDAAEMFVALAAKHGIFVCFNLFAFLPPAYDGTNPYLDSRSITGQKALATAFAKRFAGVPWVHWDLINEPSYAPLKKLWSTKPIGDSTEEAAWRAWIDNRHDHPSNGALAALWRDASDNPFAVPVDDDFERAPVQVGRHPRKARDFREFSEEAVAKWAKTMSDALKQAGGDTLVTLGQDEGGIYERATQQFLAPSLDYTAVHTWWKNDDLLWDGVMTKVPGKPSLHQETGLMRLERTDGTPWRTPEAAAKLLERKLGYAFAGRGAGVVEWVWNINPFMPLDEETTIGLIRPDGTAKPELDALEKYASFFSKAAPYLTDFEPDDVVVLIPHARAFLGMSGLIDATKPVVRILAERFGVVPTAVSDLRVDAKDLIGKKLVIVPAPSVLDERAAKALLDASKSGVRVLITGAVEGDSYGQETPSLKALGVLGPNRPVAMNEKSEWGDVAFEDLAQETVLRAAIGTHVDAKTPVWHEPLPLELARDREPLVRLLRSALEVAKVKPAFVTAEPGVAGRVLLGPRHALVVLVNERADDAKRKLLVDGHTVELSVAAQATTLAVVERATGKIVVGP